MMRVLERVLPGRSKSIADVRLKIIEFSGNMTARAVLLRGSIGTGKSTIARLIGLMKRVAPLTDGEATRILSDAKFDAQNRVDPRYIPWFVELPLTGLVESLAESQLFGHVKGAFSGATAERRGVFEQALTGRSKRGDEHVAAKLTGGVVFLDEVGDLSPSLQAKLLPVLSGGVFYRIGGEGHEEHEVRFRGVTITASWKPLGDGLLRPDLLSRISSYVIDVPGLDERMEDFDAVFDEVQTTLIDAARRAIGDAIREETLVDRGYWLAKQREIGPAGDAVRRQFSRLDWSRFGNLRGLSAALEKVIAGGARAEAVLENLTPVTGAPGFTDVDASSDILAELLRCAVPGAGLAGSIKAIEVQHRTRLREQLRSDSSIREQLATRLGMTGEQLIAAAQQLDRRRLRSPGANG